MDVDFLIIHSIQMCCCCYFHFHVMVLELHVHTSAVLHVDRGNGAIYYIFFSILKLHFESSQCPCCEINLYINGIAIKFY